MTTTILRWGHGLGLRIPMALARRAGFERGSVVEVLFEGGRICIEPVPKALTLDHLLAGMPMKTWTKWTPGRGDIVSGRTTASARKHSLVLSPAAYGARTGLALVCPIEEMPGPFAVDLPRGLPVQGAVLADRVLNLDVRSQGLRFVCSATDETVTAVLQRLAPLVCEARRG